MSASRPGGRLHSGRRQLLASMNFTLASRENPAATVLRDGSRAYSWARDWHATVKAVDVATQL